MAKVISLYQPFASLVVAGLKQYETRSWDTKYRGPLLIHATKTMPGWAKGFAQSDQVISALWRKGLRFEDLPMGAIIGSADLINTVRTDLWLAGRMKLVDDVNDQIEEDWREEYLFGNYDEGRFAWELTNPVLFDTPIPARGSQGFWNFDL